MTTKAQAFPHGAPSGVRQIANNTWEWYEPDRVRCVQLHRTVIFKSFPSGGICINTGGFESVTTKARLNMLLHPCGYSIHQANWQWYVESQHLKKTMPITNRVTNLPQDITDYHNALATEGQKA